MKFGTRCWIHRTTYLLQFFWTPLCACWAGTLSFAYARMVRHEWHQCHQQGTIKQRKDWFWFPLWTFWLKTILKYKDLKWLLIIFSGLQIKENPINDFQESSYKSKGSWLQLSTKSNMLNFVEDNFNVLMLQKIFNLRKFNLRKFFDLSKNCTFPIDLRKIFGIFAGS